jgi:hypothetical protein
MFLRVEAAHSRITPAFQIRLEGSYELVEEHFVKLDCERSFCGWSFCFRIPKSEQRDVGTYNIVWVRRWVLDGFIIRSISRDTSICGT